MRIWNLESIKGKSDILITVAVLTLSAVLILGLAGCGGSLTTLPDTPEIIEDIPPLDVEQIVNPDKDLFEGETLTIAESLFGFFTEPIAQLYMVENPGVKVEVINNYSYLERDGHFGNAIQEVSAQLMAGAGPVLIGADLLDYLDPRSRPYLTDWFQVMNADPDFSEEDWFMNVFHATALDGRLFAFPVSFSYEAVATNSTIPGLTEVMAGYDGITMQELLELHRDFPTDTPFNFEMQTHINRLIPYYIKDFVDIETGNVDLNNERFIELINYAQEIIETDRPDWGDIPTTRAGQTLISERYFFHFASPSNYCYNYFLNFEEDPLFTGLTPIIDSNGDLMIRTSSNSYILNALANPVQQALALDFIKFMMDPANRIGVGHVYMQPTNRTLLQFAIENDISIQLEYDDYFFSNAQWPLAGTPEEAVDDVVAKMTAFGEMPMQNRRSLPDQIAAVPDGVIAVALQQFQDGLVSAEQTAANLQNQVELVLMEMGVG